VLTSPPIFSKISNHHSSLTVRGIWVSNPISYSHLRFSASIISRKKLSPLVFPLVSEDIAPTLSIIQFILYLILALSDYIKKVYLFFYIRFIKAAYTPFTPDSWSPDLSCKSFIFYLC
jgi:hypothetical protein